MKCKICNEERIKGIKPFKGCCLVRCNNCHIVYINPFPDVKKNRELYEKDLLNNSKYYDAHSNDDKVSFDRRMDLVEKIIGKNPNSRLLDYGCSTGNFLEVALKHSYRAEGVELNLNSVAICRNKKLKVNEPLQKEYDLIHAGDIIEHVQEPLQFINELNTLLKEKGTLILSTPDFEKWITRKTQVKPEEHLFYFTKSTLRNLLEKCGFEILYLNNCSRQRSITSLLLSSTSQKGIIKTTLNLLNILHLNRLIDWIISNLNDDILVIARKKA